MKGLLQLLLIFTTLNFNSALAQDNGGFESLEPIINQTYSFRKGINTSSINCGNLSSTWGSSLSYPIIPLNDLNSSVSLVSQGYDEVLSQYGINIPNVRTGRRAIRLNEKIYNSSPNFHKEITGIRMPLNNVQRFISFDFRLVGTVHSSNINNENNKEAFFTVRLITSNGTVETLSCNLTDSDSQNMYLFTQFPIVNNTVFYTKWKKYEMPIPLQYVGQNVSLEIITAGCSEGGHYQIAYLDNIKTTRNSESTNCTIQILSVDYNSTNSTYEVCGVFTEPSSGGNINLNISASSGNETIQLSYLSPSINTSNNTFCYNIPANTLQFSNITNNIINFNVSSHYNDIFREISYFCRDSKSIETNRCDVQITSNTFDSNLNSFVISGTYLTPNPGNLINISIFKDINGNLLQIPVTNTSTNPNSFTFIVPINELAPSNIDIPLVVKGVFNDIAQQKSTICSDTTIIEKKFLTDCNISIGFKNNSCEGSQLMYGNYILPQGVTVNSLEVSIKDVNNNIVYNNIFLPGLNQSSINNTSFQVLINTFNLVNLVNYTFEVSVNYTHSDGFTNQSCVSEFPQLFIQQNIDIADFEYYLNSTNLSWTQFAESYLHEIVYDRSCNSPSNPIAPVSNIYPFITNTNSISLAQLQQIALANINSSTSVRWRIMLGCGEWSEWCCIQLPNSPYNIIGNCISDFTGAKNTPPYPNPTEGIIKFQNNNYHYYEVINTKGNIVKKGDLDNAIEEITIDLTEMEQDIYIVKFDNLNSFKVIKN